MDNDTLFRLERRLERIEDAVSQPPRMAHSRPETCKMLGITDPTLDRWIKAGRIKGTRTNGNTGSWLFTPEAIAAALAWTPANMGGAA